jgi:CBS domain-containing membrane protein
MQHLASHPRPVDFLVTASAAFVAICGIAFAAYLLPGTDYRALAPIAASTVIVFVMPHSPVAAPRAVAGAFAASILAAALASYLIPSMPIRMGLAVALTIAAMLRFRCIHPPGGAAAILLTIATPEINRTWFALAGMLMANAALLLATAHILNRVVLRRDEHRHQPHAEHAITRDDIRSSLRTLNEFMDADEEDLLELYDRAVEHATARKAAARRPTAA